MDKYDVGPKDATTGPLGQVKKGWGLRPTPCPSELPREFLPHCPSQEQCERRDIKRFSSTYIGRLWVRFRWSESLGQAYVCQKPEHQNLRSQRWLWRTSQAPWPSWPWVWQEPHWVGSSHKEEPQAASQSTWAWGVRQRCRACEVETQRPHATSPPTFQWPKPGLHAARW